MKKNSKNHLRFLNPTRWQTKIILSKIHAELKHQHFFFSQTKLRASRAFLERQWTKIIPSQQFTWNSSTSNTFFLFSHKKNKNSCDFLEWKRACGHWKHFVYCLQMLDSREFWWTKSLRSRTSCAFEIHALPSGFFIGCCEEGGWDGLHGWCIFFSWFFFLIFQLNLWVFDFFNF